MTFTTTLEQNKRGFVLLLVLFGLVIIGYVTAHSTKIISKTLNVNHFEKISLHTKSLHKQIVQDIAYQIENYGLTSGWYPSRQPTILKIEDIVFEITILPEQVLRPISWKKDALSTSQIQNIDAQISSFNELGPINPIQKERMKLSRTPYFKKTKTERDQKAIHTPKKKLYSFKSYKILQNSTDHIRLSGSLVRINVKSIMDQNTLHSTTSIKFRGPGSDPIKVLFME